MGSRIELEKRTVSAMIGLFCKFNHNESDCNECSELKAYAIKRLDKCPFGESKPVCKKCPVHCYAPGQREDVKKVMRFSGPKMIIHHPYLAIMHIWHNHLSVNTKQKNILQ